MTDPNELIRNDGINEAHHARVGVHDLETETRPTGWLTHTHTWVIFLDDRNKREHNKYVPIRDITSMALSADDPRSTLTITVGNATQRFNGNTHELRGLIEAIQAARPTQ